MATPLKVLILEDCALDAELMVDHLREARFDPQSRIVDTEPAYLAHWIPTWISCSQIFPCLSLTLGVRSDYSKREASRFRSSLSRATLGKMWRCNA